MIPEISNKAFGWKIKANIPASMEEAKSTTIEGVFLAIMIPVTIGTIISQGVIWNEPFKASEKAAIDLAMKDGDQRADRGGYQ